jgi:TPR repeat protein
MKVHRVALTLALAWLACALPSSAQPTQAERALFEQTKAQAEKGDVEAQLRLGALYASGTGVTKDLKKAAKWHRQAAEQGLARAQYRLALDYADGEGVKPDQMQATKWFHKAADQGMVEAQLAMGLAFLNGSGVSVNGAEAVRWLRKASEQGSPAADYELGKCYFEGTGVSRDLSEGIKWIRQAAEEGNPAAQNRLGSCYEKGEAVPKDYVQAYKWYALAAAQDDENASDIRVSIAKVESLMTKEQVAEAQQLAREFKPGRKPAPTALSNAAGQTNAVETAAAPPNPGFVTVKTGEESSEVYVDGAFVGNPPARLKLAAGAHVVEVKKPGFKDYRRELTVGAGADLNLRVDLEKEKN